MASLTWILPLLCVAGAPPPSSAVLQPPRLSPRGRDVLLGCSLELDGDITWFLLHSNQLLPLITVSKSKINEMTTSEFHTNNSRISCKIQKNASVGLEILGVQEADAGLYFCTGHADGKVHVDGVHLVVKGAVSVQQPCWSVGICVLPSLLIFIITITIIIIKAFLCPGKTAFCCCKSEKRDTESEEFSLHYSTVKYADKPRPLGRDATGLAENDVTYSAVARSHDPR